MIDFRYHLVSIASIFLALAVGIVLGAGPLKGTIGDTLTSEVTKLREDSNALRSSLSAAEDEVVARNDVINELRPRATTDLLRNDGIAVIALPGAPDSAVESVQNLLTEAGAHVPATIHLSPAWTSADPPQLSDRTAAAAAMREELVDEVPVGAAAEETLATALGVALMAPQAADGPEEPEATSTATTGAVQPDIDDETAPPAGPADDATAAPTSDAQDRMPSAIRATEQGREILTTLADHGLVAEDDSDGALLGTARGVVVIIPDADAEQPTDVAGWSTLVTTLDDLGAVSVVGAVGEESTIEGNLILAVRDDGDLSGRISTLDDLTTPVGLAAFALTVAEQQSGTAGHYGTRDSAARILPPVPPAEP